MTRFWSPSAAPAGRTPGVTSSYLRADQGANGRKLQRRQDQPVDSRHFACVARRATSSATPQRIAGLAQIGIVIGGHHRDGEQPQSAPPAPSRAAPWFVEKRGW